MSMPHNFSDDANQFPGPPQKSSNLPAIIVAIVIIGGSMMLICGGIIFGLVMTVREAQQDFQVTMDNGDWETFSEASSFEEYSEFVSEGRYSEAVENIDSSLEFSPNNAFLLNNKAWLLATCPDETVRDGDLAVELATKACELTNWQNFAYVDTIAAAYAEAGDFESAVKWQEEAIELAGMSATHEFHRRLRLFKAEKPYREGVAPHESDETEEAVNSTEAIALESDETNETESIESTTAEEE